MKKVILFISIQIILFNCCDSEEEKDNGKTISNCNYAIEFYPLSKYLLDVNLFNFNYFPNDKLEDQFICTSELNIDSLLKSNLHLPDSKFYSHLLYYSEELPIYKSSKNHPIYRFLISTSNNFFMILRLEKKDIPICKIKIGEIFNKYSYYRLDLDSTFIIPDSIMDIFELKIDSMNIENENSLPNKISLNNDYLLFERKKKNKYTIIKRALYKNTLIQKAFNYINKETLNSDSMQIPVIYK